MNLSDILFSNNEQLELVKGVEHQLLERNQKIKMSGMIAIAAAIIQIIMAAA